MYMLTAGRSPPTGAKVFSALSTQCNDVPIYTCWAANCPRTARSREVESSRHKGRLSCYAAFWSCLGPVGQSASRARGHLVVTACLGLGRFSRGCLWTKGFQAGLNQPRSSSPRLVKRRKGCRSKLNQTSWAMPEDNEVFPPGEEVASSILDSSSFLAGLMPKKEIGVHKFLEEHPQYDGRGIIVAIFDSGVDPAAAGLQITTDGKPKLIDVVDCTGSGDVDTSTVVRADDDGFLLGASGAKLRINRSWKNPSGEWRVGTKFVYQLFTDTLVNRLKKERKKKWNQHHREALTNALRQLTDFDVKHPRFSEVLLKKKREDLQTRIDLLQKVADSYDDKGPVIDAVIWHDGDVWRVALDTQDMEGESGKGKLADFTPLTNYRIERKCGVFSKMDACSFATNVYDEGNVLSIVTDSSPHGTHVAGITAAHHPEEPLLNGVAPGAQLVSCKIGDSRLGSMETGTGLTRALITVITNKCNLINMSYGEPTMVPNHGRFVELVNEVVEKHGVIFVSSAGNNGPSLSTVGAPGGTTSNILGIGAFVSPGMAASAHSIVEPPSEGLQYTWSSRGPTADGDLGVCLSAPGGAIAPVPVWTLQRRMLMNGTSMASPCACGGIALVLSALKAEHQEISPHVVRKALENTASPLSDDPEGLLTTGRGLLQVDRAYEYLRKCTNIPSVSYKVQVVRSSTPSTALRGIYLRELHDCRQASEWTIQVKPKFHEDADKLELLVPFEEHVKLESSASWVKTPEYLLLTTNGRSFNVMVNPIGLKEGVHYTEVIGVDSGAPWRGPLFRVSITVVKPMEVTSRPPVISFPNLLFTPGHIERKFIAVPEGASWAEAVFRVAGFDTPRRFFINAVQIIKKRRPTVWENAVAFLSPTSKGFSFAIQGGVTMELCVAQFWSSGIGSLSPTDMEIQVIFHGLQAGQKEIFLHGTEGTSRVDVRMAFRPVECKLVALSAARDMLPVGRQISALTLTYKFTLIEGGKVKPSFPFLNNRIYEAEFESQLYMIMDVNKRVLSTGDCYPKGVKLSKGEYTLRVHIRHDNISYLEKLKKATAFIDRTLDDKNSVRLSFYSDLDGAVTGKDAFKAISLLPGESWPFYVAAPADEKLPKDAVVGTLLIGKITFGTEHINEHSACPSFSEITYIVSPALKAEEKVKDKHTVEAKKKVVEKLEEETDDYWNLKSTSESKNNVPQKMYAKVRDAKMKLLSNLPLLTSEERKEWEDLVSTLKVEYPKHLQLFVDILQKLTAARTHDDNQIINAANDVISLIDRDGLAKFFSMKSESETADAVQVKKEMETQRDALAEALYQKGLSLANLEEKKELSTQGQKSEVFENTGGVPREASYASELTADEFIQNATAGDSVDDYSKFKGGQGGEVATGLAVVALPVTEERDRTPTTTDTFCQNFAELRKWADTSSPKYGLLAVRRERRAGRLGTAIKVLNDLIQDESKPPQKHLYEMRASLLEEAGWVHWGAHDRKLIAITFPSAYPLF